MTERDELVLDLNQKIEKYHMVSGKADGMKNSTIILLLDELCKTILAQYDEITELREKQIKLEAKLPKSNK